MECGLPDRWGEGRLVLDKANFSIHSHSNTSAWFVFDLNGAENIWMHVVFQPPVFKHFQDQRITRMMTCNKGPYLNWTSNIAVQYMVSSYITRTMWEQNSDAYKHAVSFVTGYWVVILSVHALSTTPPPPAGMLEIRVRCRSSPCSWRGLTGQMLPVTPAQTDAICSGWKTYAGHLTWTLIPR